MSMRVFKAWLPAVVMCIVIFGFSQDPHSFQHSNTLLSWLLSVVGQNTPHYRALLDRPFRKFAHFTVYFLLGAAAYRGFALGHPGFHRGAAIRSLIFSCAYAITDEIHQGLLPGRGGYQISDVALDTSSAAIALLLVYLWSRSRSATQPPVARTSPAPNPPLSARADID